MDENKIGLFIRDCRLEKGLTQQHLADRLGVTDKAVSKWERGVSYPDITLLRDLAGALGVSVTELLAGERDAASPPVPPEVEDAVVDTVAYAETARRKNGGWRFWLFVALSAGCGIAALVVCICNGFRFTWSKQVLQCLAFGWAVCYPLLRSERHPVRNAMVIASLAVYPFLWCMVGSDVRVFTIVTLSVTYMWIVYWIFLRYRQQKGPAVALILATGVLLHISVSRLAGGGLGVNGSFFIVAGTLAADCLCLFFARRFLLRREA